MTASKKGAAAEAFRGVFAAILTPVTAANAVDVPRLVAHAKALMADGAEGVALFGTTGEGPSFSTAERNAALKAVVAAGIPAQKVILGVGGPAFADTRAQLLAAEEAGCRGVLYLPPQYFAGIGEADLAEAMLQGLEGITRPVCLYHIPGMTHVAITHAVVRRMLDARPDVVAAIKDSSCDIAQTRAYLAAFPELSVLVGYEPHLAEAVPAGAVGTICGIANLSPGLVRGYFGSGADAERARDACLAMIEAMEGRFIGAMKGALAARSGDGAWTRLAWPQRPAPQAVVDALLAQMEKVPLPRRAA